MKLTNLSLKGLIGLSTGCSFLGIKLPDRFRRYAIPDREQVKAKTAEVISVIRICTGPEKRREFLLTISSLLDSIRGEEGCRDCRFYEEAGDHDSFLLVEEWNTGPDYYRHTNSEHFAVLQGALKLLSQQKHLDVMLLSRIEGNERSQQGKR